jgi:hypothetical protein
MAMHPRVTCLHAACGQNSARSCFQVPKPAHTRSGAFSLSLEAPAELRLDGRDVGLVAGSEGADLVALGMAALERVGVRVTSEQQLPEQAGLFAAGDVVAARPRTALEAIGAGLRAAEAAMRASTGRVESSSAAARSAE